MVSDLFARLFDWLGCHRPGAVIELADDGSEEPTPITAGAIPSVIVEERARAVSDEEPRTKYFRLSEWSSKHKLAQPYPPEWVEDRWRPLAETADVIREDIGEPLRVTPNGGYRCPPHNRAVGGKPASQHPQGRAADLKAKKLTPRQLHSRILALHKAGKLPRLGGLGLYAWGVHIDTRAHVKGALAKWDESGRKEQQVA